MPLGITFGLFLALMGVIALVRHGVIHPNIRTRDFIWGVSLGVVLCAIVTEVPGVGPWLHDRLDGFTHLDFIKNPDWLGPEWNDRIFWALIALASVIVARYVLLIPIPFLPGGSPVHRPTVGAGRRQAAEIGR